LGKYRNNEEVPLYLRKENFEIIKSRISRIKIVSSGAQEWLMCFPPCSINCFALSNICELMSEEETTGLFQNVYNQAVNGARVIFRNFKIPREVPVSMKENIVKDELLSR
jgi:S-adenosylmethionine:diacylglycerol 3-amino-3-carboxypropyl transferase